MVIRFFKWVILILLFLFITQISHRSQSDFLAASASGPIATAAEQSLQCMPQNLSAELNPELPSRLPAVRTANPAAVYCTDLGYTYRVYGGPDGQTGLCMFPDGRQCEGWAFLAGECGKQFSYCSRHGYNTVTRTDGRNAFSPHYAVCVTKQGLPIGVVTELTQLSEKAMGCPGGECSPTVGSITNLAPSNEVLTPQSPTLRTAPPQFDWRNRSGINWITSVKDQGYCGSCWAFGALGVIEAQYNITTNNPDADLDLAEQELVSDCYQTGGCIGGSSIDALEYVRTSGIVDEACMDYEAVEASCTTRCADAVNRKNFIYDYQIIDVSNQAIKNQVSANGPVLVYMGAGDPFGGYFDTSGIYRCANDTDVNHSVVVVGYDDIGQYWIIKNSWGATWNGDGYFKVGYGECAIETTALIYPVISSGPLPSNDDFNTAITIGTAPYTASQDTTIGTTAADDPVFPCTGQKHYHSVWYKYTPPTNGTLAVSTAGSTYDTVLGVWTGTRGFLTGQACNDDSGGKQSEIGGLPVSSGMTYYIEVAGFHQASTGILNFSITLVPLAAPTGLTATAASGSQINLAWVDTNSDESGYLIERSSNGSTGWMQIAMVNANGKAYSDTTLACSMKMYYQVRAYRGVDSTYSDYSNIANATTNLCPLAAPTSLTANGLSQSEIILAWTDTNNDESSVRVERSLAGTHTWTQIASLGKGVVTYQNTGLSCGLAYDYRVRVHRDADNSYSEYSNVAQGATGSCLPAAPTLILPGNGAILEDDPVFVWNAVTNAATYKIEIYSDAGLSQLVHSATTNAATYTTTLLPYGTLYWRVCGLSAHEEAGPWSTAWSFSLSMITPVLLAPANGSLTNQGLPMFEWQPVTGVTKYTIQIDDVSTFTSPLYNATVLSKTVFKPGVNLGNTTWYWRVRAQLPGGTWSDWSEIWSVTVDRIKPPRPTLSSPATNEIVPDSTPTFVWSVISDAVKYILQVDRNNYFNTTSKKQYEVVGTNLYEIPNGLTDGAWFWRVAAVDAAGNQSAWSAAGKFLVNAISTPVPTLFGPANPTLTSDSVLTFTWSAEADVKRYNIQIDDETSFKAPYRISTNVLTSSYRNAALPFATGTWYWRVRAQAADDGLWGDFSPYYTLIVDRTKPGRPTLSSPLSNTSTTDMTPDFMWTAPLDMDVVSYIIQIDKVNLFNSGEKIQQTVPGTVYTPSTSLVPRRWFWRVAAVDVVGNVGPWSATWNVTITAGTTANIVVIEADSAEVMRDGQWQSIPATRASGGSTLVSEGAPASLCLTFTGSQIEIIYAKQASLGAFVVEVDGQVVQTVNSRMAKAMKLAKLAIPVTPGQHTVRLRSVKGPIVIDAFLITP